MDRLKVGYVGPGLGSAPVWTGCEEGIFHDLDLEVEPVLISGSLGVSRALEEGTIQLANFAAPAPIQINLETGADLVIILGAINRLLQCLVSRPHITSPELLRGGNIGIGQKGLVNHRILQAVLPLIGLEPGVDVQLVEFPRGQGAAKLREDGHVDALVSHLPAADARRDGWNIILDMRDLDLPFQLSCVTAKRSWIANNEELTQRYLQGHIRGMFLFKQDRTVGSRVLKKYAPSEDEAELLVTQQVFAEEFAPSPYPSIDGVRNVLQTLIGSVHGADPSKAEEYVDTRFIAELEHSGVLSRMRQEYGVTATARLAE